MDDDFDSIGSIGSHLSEDSSSGGGGGEGGGTDNYGQNVFGDMFEQNTEVNQFINEIFEGAMAQLLPFGLGKAFKTQGLFSDAPIQGLFSFMELSSGSILSGANNIKPIGASLFQQKGGKSR
jgi:hypothetical protein